MDGEPQGLARSFADALIAVRDGYVGDTRERDASGAIGQKWRRRSEPAPASVQALERDFSAWLEATVSSRPVKYAIKASAGQPDRRYTLIPYAMLLRRDVTSSPTHGVYIALLFSESCQTLSLTLNQGVSQFRERFGPRRSFAALRQAASLIAGLLPQASGFSGGPARLNASNPYGQAYEVGAILSRDFDLSAFDGRSSLAFAGALNELLCLYEAVPVKIARDPSLAGNLRDAEDDERHFQEVVNHRASSQLNDLVVDAPKPPPRRPSASILSAYRRDPAVAASSLRAAKHRCEADCICESFVASATGLPYVEAHHLIPLSQQDSFTEASLDVPANVVALCATCHAKIHLAIKAAREPLIATLHAKRFERLRKSGIDCDLPQLKRMYHRR